MYFNPSSNNSMQIRPNLQNQQNNSQMNNIGQNQNFPPFMPQPPISQPYGYNNYSTIQQPLNNNFQQNFQSKPNNLTNSCNNQPQEVENYENLNIPKNGWIVDNLSFTIETKSIELVINLEDTKIGKNGNNNSKAALDAIKYIEKLLVDCSSNKGEDNNEELLEEKIKELNLNDKNISLQILKMHNDHVNEVKELKNEIKQKMEENNFLMKKVEELNKYKIKFLEEKRKQKNENKEELIKEDLIELLENNYLDNSKNKKLRDEKGGICVEIDNINSLFDIYRQKGKNVEKKAKEDESNSEISEFDILDNENGKKKKIINDEINIEEEEEKE
uniref:Uncharacterized protein n=1 Tax=Meloidogyne incognita TaxID=6306 RepID=A0A914M7P8_MELIC